MHRLVASSRTGIWPRHWAHARARSRTQLSDARVAASYADLVPLVEASEHTTSGLFANRADNNPRTVGDEFVRILRLPYGQRPFAASSTGRTQASKT